MAKSEGHDKRQKKQPPEEAEEEHDLQHDTAALVVAVPETAVCIILDLKDDIFRDNVCSFLDHESICQLIQQDAMATHFDLCKHFCNIHGTRMRSAVSKDERKEFKRRKRSAAFKSLQAEEFRDADRHGRIGGRRLNANHPGCIDCSKSLNGRRRCGECNDFYYWKNIECCGECHREACYVCFDGMFCTSCAYWWPHYCRDCFDGFHCSDCTNDFCNGCEAMVCCASETCKKVACSRCSFPLCDKCDRTLCEDCSIPVLCAVCKKYYCEDCKDGAVVDDAYFCAACQGAG